MNSVICIFDVLVLNKVPTILYLEYNRLIVMIFSPWTAEMHDIACLFCCMYIFETIWAKCDDPLWTLCTNQKNIKINIKNITK